jgi:hypothetical protein
MKVPVFPISFFGFLLLFAIITLGFVRTVLLLTTAVLSFCIFVGFLFLIAICAGDPRK